jgi:DUF4097 and DUF4098 domain-containing protein YvlB
VEAESVSGDVFIEGVRGDASVSTVSGDIEVTGGELEGGDFTSVSGSIDFEADPAKGGSFEFETHSGDVLLILPGDLSAEFDVETFSGDIENEFSSDREERKRRYGPGRELTFRTGSGDARISVTTFSGEIRLEAR